MKKIFNIIEILKDLKDLEKQIYLDSPEIFVDFADRVADNNLDEMVLFFATKYDYLSIVKFILNNDIVNLDNPSKNKQFATVKEHILAAATQFNSKDIYNYVSNFNKPTDNKENEEDEDYEIETFLKNVGEKLSDLYGQVDLSKFNSDSSEKDVNAKKTQKQDTTQNNTETNDVENKSQENVSNIDKNNLDKNAQPSQTSSYEPKFICPNCNCNIFETGYSILEKVNLKYSNEKNTLVSTSKEQQNSVNCLKCGYTIEQLNPTFLENICTVQNCKKCGKDLTSTGIVTKVKTEYDSDSNSFITSKKSYHCSECDNELTDYQVNYFKL